MSRRFVVAIGAGLVLGLLARGAMRLVAIEAGVAAGGSVGGTAEVLAAGAAVGTPVALAFMAVRARLRTRRPWPGMLCAGLVLGALAAWPPPSARSALDSTPDTPLGTAATFGVAFAAWGVGLDVAARRVLGREVTAGRDAEGANMG